MIEMRNIFLLVPLVGVVVGQNPPQQMTIAAIFDQGGDNKYEIAFRHAVEGINRNRDLLPNVELRSEIVHIAPKDTFFAEKKDLLFIREGSGCNFWPPLKIQF